MADGAILGQKAMTFPTDTTANRPTGVTGMVRFNSTLGMFEGYDGQAWNTLGGARVQDIDGNTYVSAENTPGSNNNQLRIFTDGLERQRVDNDGSTYFSQELIDNPEFYVLDYCGDKVIPEDNIICKL